MSYKAKCGRPVTDSTFRERPAELAAWLPGGGGDSPQAFHGAAHPHPRQLQDALLLLLCQVGSKRFSRVAVPDPLGLETFGWIRSVMT